MPSSFLGIYRAIYNYAPQGDGELEISEDDLLYILEKSTEDDWWNAKKRIVNSTEPEPIGLIPKNYIEEATPISQVKAVYDYERQTNEELSFTQDSILDVYDLSDPDWTLVGYDGQYGFAPANYLEEHGDGEGVETPPSPAPVHVQHAARPQPARQASEDSTDYSQPSAAAAVAAIIQQNQQKQVHYETSPVATTSRSAYTQPAAAAQVQKRVNFTPEASDEEEEDEDEIKPQLPNRPRSIPGSISSPTSPPTDFSQIDIVGVHRYSVNEVVGKKKLPATLEIGNGHITLIPHQRNVAATTWSIENLKTYSADGKRVGLDLEVPHRSLDLHAGSKEVAEEIISDLADLRGAIKAVGLREIMVAATSGGKKLGKILYDFEAQGDDEVSVRRGDEVIILDDSKSDEWWMVRRASNGKEGVVPSSYIDVKETASPPTRPAMTQHEIASRAVKSNDSSFGRDDVVGPGVKLPQRESSLASKSGSDRKPRSDQKSASRSKPDPNKVRTWTDRSSTFKVDAQFLNCRDGVIHLHKTNGVKIAVPVIKMSRQDLEYVERVTGISLDEDKPLSDIRGRNQSQNRSSPSGSKPAESKAGISIDKSAAAAARTGPTKDDYDWFDFFLGCNVDVNACQRYAVAFQRDNMDESILPDVTPSVLQNLGLKQGDILKVMKFLDNKYGRNKGRVQGEVDGEDQEGKQGGLFAGPGGTLRNNTRKGRPAPAVQTSDTVDAKVFEQNGDSPTAPPIKTETKSASGKTGFEDDAWAPKPSKSTSGARGSSPEPAPEPVTKQTQPAAAPLSGALAELSLLSPSLQPTVLSKPTPSQQEQPQAAQQQQQQQQFQPPPNILSAPLSGAPPQFFPQNTASSTQSGPQFLQYQQTGFQQNQLQPQYTAMQPQLNPLQPQATAQSYGTLPRQRPAAPQISQGPGLLAPPPPVRPLSAPGQNFAQNGYAPAPLQPTATGIPGGNYGNVQQPLPGGQLSLNDIQRLTYQQQIANQQTGFAQPGFNNQQIPQLQQPQFQTTGGFGQQGFQGSLPSQPTGFPNQGLQFQPTGFQPQQPIINQPTGYNPLPAPFVPTVNLDLPPALIPQKVNNSITNNNNNTAAALKPQPTGPAPPVKFGLTAAKLAPTPTGVRKANLRAATPQNPFGF